MGTHREEIMAEEQLPDSQTQSEEPEVNVQEWLQRLKASEKMMKDELKPRYDLARERVRAEHQVLKQRRGRPSHTTVSLLYATGRDFINSVFIKNPQANLIARNEEESEAVENTELKINDFYKDRKIKSTVKRILWDAFLSGFGARYVDYEFRSVDTGEPITEQVETVDELGNPIVINQPVINDDGSVATRQEVIKNAPIFKRIRPDLVRFPKGFNLDEYQDSPWIGFDLLVPLEEAQNDDQFDQDARERLKGSSFSKLSEAMEDEQGNVERTDIKYVKLHYVFTKPENDGEPMTLMVLSDDVNDVPLKRVDFEKGQVGYPIKFLYFNPLDDDKPYPPSDAWQMESQLAATDRWWRSMFNHIKRSHPKLIVDKRKVSQKEQVKLSSNEDQEIVGVGDANKNSRPLSELFFQLERAPLHPDFHRFLEFSQSVLSRISPRSALTQGEGESTDTATEAQIIAQNEAVDLDARADDIREFFVDLTMDLAGILSQSLVGTVEVGGKLSDGREIRRTATRENFTSNIDIDINVESFKQQNKEVLRRQLMDTMVQLKQFVEPELNKKGKSIDFEFIAKKVLEETPIRNIDQAIVDLNIRNANKEHEDLIYDGIPPKIQVGEDSELHALDHAAFLANPDKVEDALKRNPASIEILQAHLVETANKVEQERSQNNASGTISGKRPPQATELSRAKRV